MVQFLVLSFLIQFDSVLIQFWSSLGFSKNNWQFSPLSISTLVSSSKWKRKYSAKVHFALSQILFAKPKIPIGTRQTLLTYTRTKNLSNPCRKESSERKRKYEKWSYGRFSIQTLILRRVKFSRVSEVCHGSKNSRRQNAVYKSDFSYLMSIVLPLFKSMDGWSNH